MSGHPALRGLLTYATDLERAAAQHPGHARRLLAEAADVWLCLGRRDRAAGLPAGPGTGRRRPTRPRATPGARCPACLRAHSKA